MKKLELFSNNKTYMFPNGDIATPQKITAQFPAVNAFPHVIETDEGGEVCFAVMNLSALKAIHNVPVSLSAQEAIAQLEEIMNAPAPEPEPDANERIAAALEFQNLLSL